MKEYNKLNQSKSQKRFIESYFSSKTTVKTFYIKIQVGKSINLHGNKKKKIKKKIRSNIHHKCNNNLNNQYW